MRELTKAGARQNNATAQLDDSGPGEGPQDGSIESVPGALKDLNEWTIIIYHSGDSDLSEEFVWAMKEIMRVGTPDKVEVVALMDSVSPDLWMFTMPRGTNNKEKASPDKTATQDNKAIVGGLFKDKNWRAEKVDPRKWVWRGRRSRVEYANYARSNVASSGFLYNFVSQCVRNHPALHYMLILSGHGDGIIGKTLLMDQGAGAYMSVPKLNWALSEIVRQLADGFKKEQRKVQNLYKAKFQASGKDTPDPRIDILGFDACGMLTVEVASLLKDKVKYLVGSEGVMHRAGWPYHIILEYLKEKGTAEPGELAKQIVRKCVRYYADFARVGLSIEMAAVEMKKGEGKDKDRYREWDALESAFRDLTKKLSSGVKALEPPGGKKKAARQDAKAFPRDPRVRNAIIAAHWYVQSYALEEYVDLQDFCEQLAQADPEFREMCDAVVAALKAVVIDCCYSGASVQHSHGLSLFFPWVATDAQLKSYGRRAAKSSPPNFNQVTRWGSFLRKFISGTRREERLRSGDRIFMPPAGYRDHLLDGDPLYQTQPPPVSPSGRRRVPPDPRRVPPDPRLSLTSGGAFFAKIKNPALAFYEGEAGYIDGKKKRKQ